MAMTAELRADTVTLRHPERPDLTFRPDMAEDLLGFLEWLTPLSPPDRAQPARIVSAGRGMTDSEFPSISILSTASLNALSKKLEQHISADRFRGNLWLDDTAPFAEFGWIGRDIQIGTAILTVKERITRCRATMANPLTGLIDADTLGTLEANYGHKDFGIYAMVKTGGMITVSDKAILL
jgi:uncharacterized protein YcbX